MADIVYDGQPHKLTADQITAVYNRYNSTPLNLTSADYTVTSWKNTGDDPDEEDSECINAGTVTITLEAKRQLYRNKNHCISDHSEVINKE